MISGSANIGQPAHKKPFRKATAVIAQERVEYVAELLALGKTSRDIRTALKRKPHCLEYRQVAEYVTRARAWILNKASGISKAQAIAESVEFYRAAIASKETDWREKLDARKQLDLIYGTHAPKFAAVRIDPMPPPQTPADDAARELQAGGMLMALELVYGTEAANQVIEVETRRAQQVKQVTAPLMPKPGAKKLKLV